MTNQKIRVCNMNHFRICVNCKKLLAGNTRVFENYVRMFGPLSVQIILCDMGLSVYVIKTTSFTFVHLKHEIELYIDCGTKGEF